MENHKLVKELIELERAIGEEVCAPPIFIK
jgi:hypothetical protein